MEKKNIPAGEKLFARAARPDQVELTKQEQYNRDKHLLVKVWCLIGLAIIGLGLLRFFGIISTAIQIMIIAIVISFLALPIVNFLDSKGIHRGIGTLVAYLVFGALIAIVFALFIPVLAEQVISLISSMPTYVNYIQDAYFQFYSQYSYLLQDSQVHDMINKATSWLTSNVPKLTNTALSSIMSAGTSMASVLMVIFMSLIVGFWLTMELPKFHKEAIIIAGPKHSENLEIMTSVFARSMGGYIKGTIINSACTGLMAGLGYWFLGVPYAGLLGLLTGILNIIPYVGPWMGGAIAAFVALLVSPLTSLFSIIVTVAAQQITDTFISPKVMQSAVAVHPLLVIVGLIAGSAIAGIPGMIFTVPLLAAAKSLYTYYFEKKTGRQLISEDGAVFKGEPFNDEDGNPIPAFDATGGSKYYSGKFASRTAKRSMHSFRRKERKEKRIEKAQEEAEKENKERDKTKAQQKQEEKKDKKED